ncbi:sensor histidine kinase [Actinocatenispora rupis]|uniref:histidine kinase n=1 Tax=Actinocatenispora rupis TaxID=519421 RepID=A0A8J3NG28_9ACTN|nr:histidine kinase [Actinocatenispora rupis]GID15937.1 two-component sensor histidine kinase [Actinocatenispora rupis]
MWAAIRRLFRLPLKSVVFDVCAAGLLGVLALVPALSGERLAVALGVLTAAAVVVRRRWPVPVFAVVCLLGLVQVLTEHRAFPYDVAVLFAMYTVVKYADRMLWAWVAAGTVVAGCVLHGVVGDETAAPWYQRAATLVVTAAPFWLVALVMRTRRLYVRSLEDRAATAERERDQRARLAVADERGRIARELHDVVAHSLAVMIVQADGASYAMDGDPATAKDAVRTVAATGREALADMRRLVAVLRGPAAGEPPDATVPEPGGEPERRRVGVGRLTELTDRFDSAGVAVTVRRVGPVRELPGSVDLAGYRIVQEALTNVLKHAGVGTAVTVTVTYAEEVVVLEVVDDGAGRNGFAERPLPGGHGLLGMRERVAVYGGEFVAGPRTGGGWRVAATIPLAGPDTAADTVDRANEEDA